MDAKFIFLFVILSFLFVGCSNCNDFTDKYAVVEADSTYVAYAQSFEYDKSIYPSEEMDAYYSVHDVAGAIIINLIYDRFNKENNLVVEIFGCRTRNCKEASSVVIHNSDYSYMELFHPPQFEISKAKESRQINDDYEEKVIDFLFHLNLKTDSIFISWDVEVGKGKYEHCTAPLNPGW